MSNKTVDLTEGPIFKQLLRLALPIIGTSMMQMAYNLTDMLWLGRVGSDAVSSVGAAGFYVWLGMSLLLITRVGAEISVSQSLGQKNTELATRYARHALIIAGILSFVVMVFVLLFTTPLIHIFKFSSLEINANAVSYLRIVAVGFLFTFVNPTFQGVYNGMGNSKSPFYYLLIGLGLNIILDPIFIFGFLFIPAMGVSGAALATVVAQAAVFLIFMLRFVWLKEMMDPNFLRFKWNRKITQRIFKLGFPVALESSLFAIFALILARLITQWGDLPIAIQSVGAQLEALSWMTSSGFATALGSFVGQNYGARKWERIRKGYFITIGIGVALGVLVTFVFIFGGKGIFGLFFNEPQAVAMGVVYLNILAVSQVFMILEIITRGAFNGLGKTIPPSIIGIVFTGLRVPVGWMLSLPKILGMVGVWWAISLSSVVKGLVSMTWFIMVVNQLNDKSSIDL